jgi:peptidoglycan/xylan/chitin deacetylase (PgdA/CDA1 family)
LTFDDGFADFYESALPILDRYGVTATLYVVSGLLGGSSRWLEREGAASLPLLSWPQLTQIAQSGIEIGSHTRSHAALDMLPITTAKDEILSSKRALEDGLGMQIRSFAYPYGYYSRAVQSLVASAGYTSACAVRYAMSSPIDDRFALCRQIVRGGTSIKDFDAILSGRAPRLHYDRLRSKTWRYLRRALHRSR